MGWDPILLGLKHSLPVDDPMATAQELSKRLERNVVLVCEEFWYDEATHTVATPPSTNYKELARFRVDDSPSFLRIIDYRYPALYFQKHFDAKQLENLKFKDSWFEAAVTDPNYYLYLYDVEEEDSEAEFFDLSISRENFDRYAFSQRWSSWARGFYEGEEARQRLWEDRMAAHQFAKLMGCEKMIICSDQGPATDLYDHIDWPAEKLWESAISCSFYDTYSWDSEEEKVAWMANSRPIHFADFFTDKTLFLNEEDFVEVVMDDFSDLEQNNHHSQPTS